MREREGGREGGGQVSHKAMFLSPGCARIPLEDTMVNSVRVCVCACV